MSLKAQIKRWFRIAMPRHSLLGSALVGAVLCSNSRVGLEVAYGLDPVVYKQLELKLKVDKEITEKRREKDKALSAKGDKVDLAPVNAFYIEYLIPRLTQVSPDIINETRREILEDIVKSEANKDTMKSFNELLVRFLGAFVKNNAYHPSSRINGLVFLTRLNAEIPKTGSVRPETTVQPTLIGLVNPTEIDGLVSLSLSSIQRHLAAKAISDAGKKKLVENIKAFFDAPTPPTRSEAAQIHLRTSMLDCLTLVSRIEPEKEPSKLATELLSSQLKSIFEKEESEWLLETACHSLGLINPVNISEEEAVKIQVAVAKFARKSLTEWKRKIQKSSAEGGMGGMGGMGPGGMGGMGGEGGEGMGGGGYGGEGGMGPGGPGGQRGPKKNPYESQPKEVKNARRMAHQRLERIHVALNGEYRKPDKSAAAAAATPAAIGTKPVEVKPTENRGLIKLLSASEATKAKTVLLIEKVEKFQADLNEEKIADLTTLIFFVAKSTKELRELCMEITGEKKEEIYEFDEENVFSGGNSGGGKGAPGKAPAGGSGGVNPGGKGNAAGPGNPGGGKPGGGGANPGGQGGNPVGQGGNPVGQGGNPGGQGGNAGGGKPPGR